jgi:hypothetical protein
VDLPSTHGRGAITFDRAENAAGLGPDPEPVGIRFELLLARADEHLRRKPTSARRPPPASAASLPSHDKLR